ncbi:unnamed protein product [Pieris macdunnoughi]|uniref:Peptidase S1 domain-containing protein n=1 Tax=Pieris macdunnoughi TaxID=345717 RepID=A0A821QAT2_9NEOP|nr:unnamed protein product [Pieris macdunnoughi]
MRILALLSLCYFMHISNSESLSNLLGYYLGFRRLCLCRCGVQQGQKSGIHSRMLGGETIQPLQMPWLVYIHTNKTFTGTLISNRHVITAASNLYDILPSKVSVTLGSNGLCDKAPSAFNASVEAILINPKYSPSRKNNDIALIKLHNEVLFTAVIAPICMPIYDIGNIQQLAEVASVATDEKKISTYCAAHTASLPILSERSCLSAINSSFVTPDKGCLGPVGAIGTLCQSDIGAPVMTRFTTLSPYRLIGVLSSASCYEKQTSLYTRIIDHLPWIHENIRRDCQCF